MADNPDFITKYMEYTAGTEVPAIFNRWACIGAIGAMLEQDAWFPFLNGKIFGNMYIMLVGSAGARKSTAIKGVKRILIRAGYNHFAGEKTSKEQFLVDLQRKGMVSSIGGGALPEDIIFQEMNREYDKSTAPCTIAADEFNDFFGNNILEFLSMLGVLWDKEGPYDARAKSGNVVINNPNISILSGNTVETLNTSFPVEAMGQGFFSRMMFIYGAPNGVKIAFPENKSDEEMQAIADDLIKVKESCYGELEQEPAARKALERIYDEFKGLDDERFASYSSRRFTNLLKLCIIHAAAGYSKVITLEHVRRAHTVLVHAEHYMPQALGEYGHSKSSALNHLIIQVLKREYKPMSFSKLLEKVITVTDNVRDLGQAMTTLCTANKVIQTDSGFLPVRRALEESDSPLINWQYLTAEERNDG